MWLSKRLDLPFIALLTAISAHPASGQTYSFTRIDLPFPAREAESPGINNRGAIVGTFYIAKGRFVVPRGFKRHANGVLEYPLKDPTNKYFIVPSGINDLGEIVGSCIDELEQGVGGCLLRDGKIFTAGPFPPVTHSLISINNKGDFLGYTQYKGDIARITEGPIPAYTPFPDVVPFTNIGGQLRKVDSPPGHQWIAPQGIAQDGTLVGCSMPFEKAFIRGPQQRFLWFRAPGSGSAVCAQAINNQAQTIAGFYTSSAFATHGFIYNYRNLAQDFSGETLPVVTVDYPGAKFTVINGVNSSGVIVGTALMDTGSFFVFIGAPDTPLGGNAR